MEFWRLKLVGIPMGELDPAPVAEWLGGLPEGTVVELAWGASGLELRLGFPEGAEGAALVRAWGSLLRHGGAGERMAPPPPPAAAGGWALRGLAPALRTRLGDPLAMAAARLSAAYAAAGRPPRGEVALQIRLGRADPAQQARWRAFAAYAYGTESGARGLLNPWGIARAAGGAAVGMGALLSGLGLALGAGGGRPEGLLMALAGLVLGGFGGRALGEWVALRSVPAEVLSRKVSGTLRRVSFRAVAREMEPEAAEAAVAAALADPPFDGPAAAVATGEGWPPPAWFSTFELAPWLTPPARAELAAWLSPASRLDMPAPPAAPGRPGALILGRAVATGEPVGVDPDAHMLVVGGTRTGKSSAAFRLIRSLMDQPDPPGLWLFDPHLTLAYAVLAELARREGEAGEALRRRLVVLDPRRPEVVPLNLLAVPDFAWAGNALIQAGRRIWSDYWGPRMQAALLGLSRLAHAWNQRARPEERLSLFHTVFAAYNRDWRHMAIGLLPPMERANALALDALLGQMAGEELRWGQAWLTEVISPVLSKVMALELSPWLFAAMTAPEFAPVADWLRERRWVLVLLPVGSMGLEAARLMAAILYNVLEAVYAREAQERGELPLYVVIDEFQQIGEGMMIEIPLSALAKYGLRMAVLVQSLAILERQEALRGAVPALLANTGVQLFFSPSPEDRPRIQAMLAEEIRYGAVAWDMPALEAMLRARQGGRWQPPVRIRLDPLPPAETAAAEALAAWAIAREPGLYRPMDRMPHQVLRGLAEMLPPEAARLLQMGMDEAADLGETDLRPGRDDEFDRF
jgi:hypothetical protein